MDATPIYQGLFGILSVIGLSAVGVPVGVSLATVGLLGLYIVAGSPWQRAKLQPWRSLH